LLLIHSRAKVSPSREGSVMPLTRRTLTMAAVGQASAAAFAPTGRDCVGVEIEWPVHRIGDVSARPSADDAAMLESLPLPAGSRITFEPGGQVELSTAPAPSATAALRAAETDSRELHRRMAAAGFACETLAVDGRRPPRRILQRPRYQAMERFFSERGAAGAWMMCNTASTQVNISHEQADPHQRWHTMNLIAPVLIATFANSPGRGGDGRCWASLRQAIWWSIDPLRTSPVRTDLVPELAWQEYALAADVMFINTGGGRGTSGTAVRPGLPFGRWMAAGHATGWPTIEDYRYHLTTLFPPVRPRGWLELRALDALPGWIRDVAVLTVAAACTADASRELRRHQPDTRGLWLAAARDGLNQPVLAEAARTLIAIVVEHLASVTTEPAHAALVEEFAARYVRRGLTPGSDSAAGIGNLPRHRALVLAPARPDTRVAGARPDTRVARAQPDTRVRSQAHGLLLSLPGPL
jgi:glutamate--cysteine ligase